MAFDLYVRGAIPAELSGSLVVATSRRHKRRDVFGRWQDSQADLIRLDLYPGKPGRIVAHVLPIDPTGADLPSDVTSGPSPPFYAGLSRYGYVTQPNHGLNLAGSRLWVTNLLFGAPIELDLQVWKPERILRYVEPDGRAPGITSTSHFAWSIDGRYAYFHQSLLRDGDGDRPVQSEDLRLIALDVASGRERIWKLLPPDDDNHLEAANFHSAFYFEEAGKRCVGLLRTGAVIGNLRPHPSPGGHRVFPSLASTIWIVELDDRSDCLQATLLPGIRELNGLALSHLDVDNTRRDGFVLYANYKEADVAEETHGPNMYGVPAASILEHYSGMIVEALNYGQVLRYERRHGSYNLKVFQRPYDCERTSLGHTWLPINVELDSSRESVFCSFSGFRPRLLAKHIWDTYPDRAVDPNLIRFVPSLLLRMRARDLSLDQRTGKRDYISYTEPIALAVVGDSDSGYVCTFSPEVGLRIYRACDLGHMVGQATGAPLSQWQDSHFRPEPAHMVFWPR
jgi:hypothetical protein